MELAATRKRSYSPNRHVVYYYSLLEVLEELNSCQLQLEVQLQTRHHLKPAADRELGEGLGQIGQTFSK